MNGRRSCSRSPGNGPDDRRPVGPDPHPDARTPLRRSFPATSAAAGLARVAAVEWLRERDAGDDLSDRVALAVSELVSNAVEGSAVESSAVENGDQPIAVDAVERPDRFEITVTNRAHDPSIPERDDWRPEHALADRGRGLFIVDTVADRVQVDVVAGAVTVTAVFDRSPG